MTYKEALEALRAQQPRHILLRLLSIAETPANRIILDRELSKFSAPKNDAPPMATPGEETGVLDELHRQQATLFGERRKLSNSFHNCETDSDRRGISERIFSVQRKIEGVRAQMRDYKSLGYLPQPDDKYPVPEDPFRLLALRASLRSSISRKTREALTMASAEQDQDSKKMAAAENKLRDLKNHLERVQKAIKDRNIQPSGLREG